MRRVQTVIQNDWMRRRGWRGKWLTWYWHEYSGGIEQTERFHSHPWLLAIGIVLEGHIVEQIEGNPEKTIWSEVSIRFYTRKTRHRVIYGRGKTLFIGLCRTQKPIEKAATVKTREGYCHYTELMPDEEGYRIDISSSY